MLEARHEDRLRTRKLSLNSPPHAVEASLMELSLIPFAENLNALTQVTEQPNRRPPPHGDERNEEVRKEKAHHAPMRAVLKLNLLVRQRAKQASDGFVIPKIFLKFFCWSAVWGQRRLNSPLNSIAPAKLGG